VRDRYPHRVKPLKREYMKVLSLFDGMSCGLMALRKLKDIVEKNVENRFFLSECTTGKIITEYPTRAVTLMDKSKCLTTGAGKNVGKRGSYVIERGGIRRLTVREAARLQTIPDDYTFVVSERESYKMIGNGWTVDVISHILSFMP